MSAFDVIAFDGDDTLWHNESIFSVTEERYRALLKGYVPDVAIDERLFATEMRNLGLFGYGIKAFMLSMIETAIEVTEGRIATADIQTIIDWGKEMLSHPVELLEGVREAIEVVAPSHRVMLITKGDLFDQESKIARSGLGDLFWKVEIVSEKDPETYRRILRMHGIQPERFLMVGNSPRSDILPVIEIGGWAVHIPYHLIWAHEAVERRDKDQERLFELESMGDLPELLSRIEAVPAPQR